MASATSSLNLINKVKDGSTEASSLLFEKYHHRLAVLIHYKLRPKLRSFIDVDDVLQETLIKAYRELNQFNYRGPGSFMNWLSCIADHIIVDGVRYQGRQKRYAEEVLRFRSESNPHGPEPIHNKTPTRLLRDNEDLQILLKKLDALPENYREVILLSKVESLSAKEVAQRLGKTNEATALLLHRAIKRFRSLIDSSEEL